MKPVLIPNRLEPGDIYFYLDLSLITDLPKLYKLLTTLGIQPQLAYSILPSGEVDMLLLLAHDRREELTSSPDDFYWEEQQVLANEIDTEAIHCRARLTTPYLAVA